MFHGYTKMVHFNLRSVYGAMANFVWVFRSSQYLPVVLRCTPLHLPQVPRAAPRHGIAPKPQQHWVLQQRQRPAFAIAPGPQQFRSNDSDIGVSTLMRGGERFGTGPGLSRLHSSWDNPRTPLASYRAAILTPVCLARRRFSTQKCSS
jgi:hypothetical protein